MSAQEVIEVEQPNSSLSRVRWWQSALAGVALGLLPGHVSVGPRDEGRGEVEVLVDPGTGVEYVTGPDGGIFPRLDAEGETIRRK